MKLALCFLRSVLHSLWFFFSVFPWAIAILLLPANHRLHDRAYRLARNWLAQMSYAGRWICGMKWQVEGMEHVRQATGPLIIASKHQSIIETFLLPVIVPRPIAYIFKRELIRVPFFGWAMARLDMIHIDRSQRREAAAKVAQQGKRLLALGVAIAVFPEGTRARRWQRGEYKSGSARLAIETGASIIPVAIASARCWPRKSFLRWPGTTFVRVGAPISSAGKDPAALMAEVENWIEGQMLQLDPPPPATQLVTQ